MYSIPLRAGLRTVATGILLGIFSTQSPAIGERSSPLWGSLKPGRFAVGFKSSIVIDNTRKLIDGKTNRPIQTSIWYPAQQVEGGMGMRYRDYFLLSLTELTSVLLSPESADKGIAEYEKFIEGNGVPKSAVEAWFDTPCYATRNATPVDGKYPLLVVGQGLFHSAHHQAILAEYLASHGYVVVTTPSQSKINGPMTSESDVYPHAKDQSKDLAIAIQSVSKDPHVDASVIGVVAHSFGARSALLLAMHDKRVKSFVSLDGGIGNGIGKEWIKLVPGFNPASLKMPFLHFYEDIESFINPDFELIKSMTACERTLMKIEQMHHFYFSTFGIVTATIPGFTKEPESDLQLKWEAVSSYTLNFLDASLKKDKNASAFLAKKPIDNGYGQNLLTIAKVE
jgi:hypothetical protein